VPLSSTSRSTIDDHEPHYRAVEARDPRFDGWFVAAVTSTGIYCRPSCPARTPARRNVRFYPTPAAAQGAGFRACKRCRPDAAPGSPEWRTRTDLAARAMALIADGVVDRDGVGGLSRRLGYGERHLNRLLTAELGAGPQALARAQRAQTARILIETTDLPFTTVAFGAGFSSVRQFNDTVREIFAASPTEMRSRAIRHRAPTAGSLTLRLPHRRPFAAAEILHFLARRAVAGLEEGDGTAHRRTLALPHGGGTAELVPAADHVRATLHLDDIRDLTAAVERCRHLLDLDADPVAVDERLGADPVLGPLVGARPGLRLPGCTDPFEVAVRTVVGQQVSVAAARTVTGRLVACLGEPLVSREPGPAPGLTHRFPTPLAIAAADPSTLGMPLARGRALVALAAAVADGHVRLDRGVAPDETRAALLSVPGIGPWTASLIALRGRGDPDEFLPTDLGVRHALGDLGLPSHPAAATALADTWRPWRSYALVHLWAHLDAPHVPTPGRPDPTPPRSTR